MMGKHLVIARWNEVLDWVVPTNMLLLQKDALRTFIYNKGSDFGMNLYNFSANTEIVNLTNEGRDGGTLLYHLQHINRNSFLIPEQLVFLQGNPFDHLPQGCADIRQPHFLPYYIASFPKEDYVYLNGVLECDQYGKPHHVWDLDLVSAVSRIGHIAYKNNLDFSDVPFQFRFSPGMSQIIPRICLEAPAEFWYDLDCWLLEHENHGYELERLWPYIFSNIKKHNENTSKGQTTPQHSGHQ
jgi:hypothetical protein